MVWLRNRETYQKVLLRRVAFRVCGARVCIGKGGWLLHTCPLRRGGGRVSLSFQRVSLRGKLLHRVSQSFHRVSLRGKLLHRVSLSFHRVSLRGKLLHRASRSFHRVSLRGKLLHRVSRSFHGVSQRSLSSNFQLNNNSVKLCGSLCYSVA
jgi:hypothetical protein